MLMLCLEGEGAHRPGGCSFPPQNTKGKFYSSNIEEGGEGGEGFALSGSLLDDTSVKD